MRKLAEIIEISLNELRISVIWKFWSFIINQLLLQLLLFVFPLIAGYFVELFITDVRSSNQFSISMVVNHWPMILFLILYILAKIYESNRLDYYGHSRYIYNAIEWMHKDLGFDKIKDADIRCTLWTPKFSTKPIMRHNFDKIRLKQIVNYVPDVSNINSENKSHRKNRCSGRIRRIARKIKGTMNDYESIGLVGECLILSLEDRELKICYENLGENESFLEYMVERWNFLPFEAKRLTQDRRSYMACSLMDSATTDILGILFFDSRLENTFKDKEKSIQKYLPRIAKLLVNN